MSEKLCALKKIVGGINESILTNAIWQNDFGDQGATIPTTISMPAVRTYEFEAIVPTQGSQVKAIFSFGGSNTAGGDISLSNTRFSVYANGSIVNDTSLNIDTTRKHHIAIVMGTDYIKLYVDNHLIGSYNTTATTAMRTSRSFVFGVNESSSDQNWNGGVLYKLAITSNSGEDFVL